MPSNPRQRKSSHRSGQSSGSTSMSRSQAGRIGGRRSAGSRRRNAGSRPSGSRGASRSRNPAANLTKADRRKGGRVALARAAGLASQRARPASSRPRDSQGRFLPERRSR
ncbi:MAG TPA: hypothetical protein VFH47_08120 [Candidatus Thermoplasmatota archaeon]|nr:hypothetical protein [Candidatus Thermoplasmatota archaeon]